MIHYVKGDIVENKYEPEEYGVFCHQVNCCKTMDAGLAKQIKEKYPEVYQAYEDREYPYLGAIDWVLTHDGRACVNMYAQNDYGRSGKHTNYIAFAQCLTELAEYLIPISEDTIVAFPYGIGCGLGGGDWKVISALIEDFDKMIKQKVYIVKKE